MSILKRVQDRFPNDKIELRLVMDDELSQGKKMVWLNGEAVPSAYYWPDVLMDQRITNNFTEEHLENIYSNMLITEINVWKGRPNQEKK